MYQGTTNAADRFIKNRAPYISTPCIGPGCPVPSGGLVPGIYFVVVQDPTTDCKSGPKEVDILDDQIVYPVVNINETASQISCISTVGTAILAGTADGQAAAMPITPSPVQQLDLTGLSSDQTAPHHLTDGNYSLNATNATTGCSASALYYCSG